MREFRCKREQSLCYSFEMENGIGIAILRAGSNTFHPSVVSIIGQHQCDMCLSVHRLQHLQPNPIFRFGKQPPNKHPCLHVQHLALTQPSDFTAANALIVLQIEVTAEASLSATFSELPTEAASPHVTTSPPSSSDLDCAGLVWKPAWSNLGWLDG